MATCEMESKTATSRIQETQYNHLTTQLSMVQLESWYAFDVFHVVDSATVCLVHGVGIPELKVKKKHWLGSAKILIHLC